MIDGPVRRGRSLPATGRCTRRRRRRARIFRGVQAAGRRRRRIATSSSPRRSRRSRPPWKRLAARQIAIAAQDIYWATEGAFTGEVSAPMLVEAGCRAVIIAHSERRQFFGETDETANRKVRPRWRRDLRRSFAWARCWPSARLGPREQCCRTQFRGGPGRVDRLRSSRVLSCVRAGVGHRHGPHGDPGNRSRGAPVPARTAQRRSFRRSAPPRCGFSTAAASSPTTSRVDGAGGYRRGAGGRRESGRQIVCRDRNF